MPRSRKPVRPSELKTTRKGTVKRRSILWRLRRVFFLVGLVMTVGIGGVGFIISKVVVPTAAPASQTSFICADDVASNCNASNALAKLHGEQDRVEVKLDVVPQNLQHAVISIEDRNFFKHGGVDPVGIARAALADIRGKSEQGGSTITQQYVKNVYLTQERTLSRKLKEAVISVKLEQKMTKKQILEAYLNTIYFGRGAYGVQAAARTYFGKDVNLISLDQAAFLAGLINGPASHDYSSNQQSAIIRRQQVLDAMVREKYITQAERNQADIVAFDAAHGYLPLNQSRQVALLRNDVPGAEYFVEYIRQYLINHYGEAAAYGGGLRVYTTINPVMQAAAYTAVTDTLNRPEDPAASIVAVDENGHIKAMMGGRDFSQSQVNLALGRAGGGGGRQPGSTFKAFALSEAVREGYSIESTFSAPQQIVLKHADNGADWKVNGGCCGGVASLIQATQFSINTVYAQLMVKLGPDKVVALANQMGVTARLQPNNSLVLGTGEVSVLDMASAYSTFADQGTHIAPIAITRVEDANGHVLESFTPQRSQVLTPSQCSKVVYALQQVVKQGGGGTGVAANTIGRPMAGKTGTTNDNKDAWFVGFTPHLTAAVWMGYPNSKVKGQPIPSMTNVHGLTVEGGSFPAQMWAKFMRIATQGNDTKGFPDPGDLSAGKFFGPPQYTNTTVISVPTPTLPTTVPGSTSSTTTTTPTHVTTPTTTPVTTPPTTTPVTVPPTTLAGTTTGH